MGPEHSYPSDIGRVTYEPVTDTEAMDALSLLGAVLRVLSRRLNPLHALAGAGCVCQRWAKRRDPEAAREKTMIARLSGRGDNDVETALKWFGLGDSVLQTLMTGNKEAAASTAQNAQAESEAGNELPGRYFACCPFEVLDGTFPDF